MNISTRKVAIFIDGANLRLMAKALKLDIDFKCLLKEFEARGTVLRAIYYSTVDDGQEFSSIRPLIDWLDYNGFTVVTKAIKEFSDDEGRRKIKSNMRVELAVNALDLAAHIDEMILFSGDGDFRPLVEAMKRRGVYVTVVSSVSVQPPMITDQLRRQADCFIDLATLKPRIERGPAQRPVSQEVRARSITAD